MALTLAAAVSAVQPDSKSIVADRVMALTRNSSWTLVASVPIAFRTFHPQGMVKIGETLFVSSVEVIDRDAGKGVGHLLFLCGVGRDVGVIRGGLDLSFDLKLVGMLDDGPDDFVDEIPIEGLQLFREISLLVGREKLPEPKNVCLTDGVQARRKITVLDLFQITHEVLQQT